MFILMQYSFKGYHVYSRDKINFSIKDGKKVEVRKLTNSVDRFEYLERSKADKSRSNPENNCALLVYRMSVVENVSDHCVS